MLRHAPGKLRTESAPLERSALAATVPQRTYSYTAKGIIVNVVRAAGAGAPVWSEGPRLAGTCHTPHFAVSAGIDLTRIGCCSREHSL